MQNKRINYEVEWTQVGGSGDGETQNQTQWRKGILDLMIELKVDEFVGKVKNQKGKICTQIEIFIESFKVKLFFYFFFFHLYFILILDLI